MFLNMRTALLQGFPMQTPLAKLLPSILDLVTTPLNPALQNYFPITAKIHRKTDAAASGLCLILHFLTRRGCQLEACL